MTDEKGSAPGDAEHVACPFCTIQIRADEAVCPHCRQAIPLAPGGRGEIPVPKGIVERYPALHRFLVRYGKWIKAITPAVVGLIALLVVYGRWVKIDIRIDPNPALPVRVSEERKGNLVILKGTVENRGEDVHELSLKSIGIVVETAYRDGRRTKKTVFPRSPHRGEGTLLHGETGTFEIEVPRRELKAVSFRSEVVDLGSGLKFVQPHDAR